METKQDHSTAANGRQQHADELVRLQQKADEYLKGWQRAKADYSNLKKQTEKEKEELGKFANAALLIELLPIYNHLKRATAQIPDAIAKEEWVAGIRHIRTEFQRFLTRLGIEEIPTHGRTFDPALHEAVARERRDGVAENQILEEVAAGFTLHGNVLLPAKVKVCGAEGTKTPK